MLTARSSRPPALKALAGSTGQVWQLCSPTSQTWSLGRSLHCLVTSMAVQHLWYDFGMKRAVKVAISLPDDLLHRVDRARRERKVSRSEYFRQAASNLLGLTGKHEVERYVRGYSKHPETSDEVEAARAASARSLAAEPWE